MLQNTFLLLIITLIIYLFIRFYGRVRKYFEYANTIKKLPTQDGKVPVLGHLPMFLRLLETPEKVFNLVRKWSKIHSLYYLQIFHILAVIACKPDDIEIILSSTKHTTKGNLYKFLDLWLAEGLLTSCGSKWQFRRKILTPAFHFNILQQFIGIFNKETDTLVKCMENKCRGNEVHLAPLIDNFTLNTINETSMGVDLNIGTNEGIVYKDALIRLSSIFFQRFSKQWPIFFNTFYYNVYPLGREEMKCINKVHRFTDNIIKRRQDSFEAFSSSNDDFVNEQFSHKKKKLALLDLLLNSKLKEKAIDDRGIREEVNTFMFEGHDTVSTNLNFTLMLLACHQDIQERIYQEILQVVGTDTSKQPTYNDFQELTYMERCIKESLRLYPSVPLIGRILSENITTSCGVVPKDTEVYIHIYDLHRDPEIWPDPEKFDPDRFLPENCQTRHPFAYLPFSAGPRNCIGQRFAMLEIKSALCGILKHFKLYPVDRPEDLILYQEMLLKCKNNIRVKLALR